MAHMMLFHARQPSPAGEETPPFPEIFELITVNH
jgi:hypothetical protein